MNQHDQQSRQWAMFCHLSALSGYLIPFGHIIGPLIVWLIKKDEMPLVNEQGKEALNFQISMTMWMFVAFLLIFVLIGFLLLPALALAHLILTIIGAVRANNGETYHYPLTIRFLS